MISPFIEGKAQLIKSWKLLRSSLLPELTDIQHLKLICDFWKNAPFRYRMIDWDHPELWPDPWELMHSAEFDESAIALGMFYTLYLGVDSRWTTDRIKLVLARDSVSHIQRIMLIVDNKLALNLDHGTIVELDGIKSQLTIQQRYSYDGKLHKILNHNVAMNSSDNHGN